MIEQSCKLALRAYVFETNDANTWLAVKSLIASFLTNIWKEGGLQGTSPDDAFQVNCGLGTTMTPDDLLNGIMNVTILVAAIHPAEFTVITISQEMETA
jgi:phage tail sheath protein FI